MRMTPNEVGPIPKTWRVCAIRNVATKITNGFVGVATPHYSESGTGVRYLLGTNIRPNRITSEDVTFVSAEFSEKNAKSILSPGDLLTVQSGHIGTTAVVPNRFAGANCHALIITRLDLRMAHPGFVSHYLNSSIGKARLRGLHVGSSVPHINTSELGAFHIPLPPPEEQQRISAIADTWDEAISNTENLLANSRARKSALASVVLMGKRRVGRFGNGAGFRSTPHGYFPKDWGYPAITEVASEVNEKHLSGQPQPVLSCTKHAGLVDSLTYFKKQVFSKDLSTYKVVPRRTFAYATNHIEEGSIGYQDLYEHGLVSPMYTVFRTTDRVCDGYLYRLLKTERFRQIFEAATNSSVNRRGSLRWNDFKKLRIPLPSVDEQEEIAGLLEVADKEIGLLQQQVQKLRQEKATLMRQLLTGKRRVRIPAAAVEAEPA